MTRGPEHAEVVELRRIPWLAFLMCGLSGFLFLITAIVLVVVAINPPKKVPPAPWVPYAILAATAALFLFGIYLFRHARVGLRLTPREIELPEFGVSIPWGEISEVSIVELKESEAGLPRSLLVLRLSEAGRSAIGDRLLTDSPLTDAIEPRPDVCLKLGSFLSYGPGIDTNVDFAADLRRRIGAASGEAEEGPSLPPLDAPLELRDMSSTGPTSRIYIHDECGDATEISGSSFYWVANPLRYAAGTKCVRCGGVLDISVRWQDTGETLSRFRSRMWRHTPLRVKVLQFAVAPGLVGVASFILVTAAPNIAPMVRYLAFGLGFLVSLALLWLTPLAGVIPALTGMAYHKYR